jgi:hypothetical protein
MMNNRAEQAVSWLTAFGAGSLPGEASLLEELEINLTHVKSKTFSVLNPFRSVDKHIMDDTDLVGPLLFCGLFGVSLLLTGKVHFGFIYGVALCGWLSIWGILNAMSSSGIGSPRTASVLGYCLLPMVLLSCLLSVVRGHGNLIGLIMGSVAVFWCSFSASNMFVAVLSMQEQRLLIAYPIFLFYFCFALLTIF